MPKLFTYVLFMLMAISLFFVGLQRRQVEVAVTLCVVVGVL